MTTQAARMPPLHHADTTATSGEGVGMALRFLGRGAFAIPFAVFGILHFLNASAMAGMVPVPGGAFWMYFTGAALIAGSVGILTGILGKWAALGLAALMLTFILFIHIPGLGDPKTQQMATMGLLKDLALLGGALTWAALFHEEKRRGD